MTQSIYPEPVSKLVTLGDVRGQKKHDYLALGITTEHIPELSRMALDDDLQWADSDSDEVWAPLHAWRALGQLGDPEGIPTLITVISHVDEWDDDWATGELPQLLAMIGEPAIEPLRQFLADYSHGPWSQTTAVNALEKIAQKLPQHRGDCVSVLREALRGYRDRDAVANGALTSTLVELGAVEAVDVLEEAFAADDVDLSIAGDWEEAQIKLGLLKERKTPVPYDNWFEAEMERERRQLQKTAQKERRNTEQRRLENQRHKRAQARKQAKKTKKKQRSKKKRKKR